ncbi:polysaccharide biosynthesis protein [Halosquirtibacter xylanolyticus]|uniref:polysaccharide biosynthesis protein n=1 Tax=Halosquirtibacter xylanolyticus TaxID=3374599 RepID=UPI00374A4B06|nr:polysaccharide biosynthesis protein [Prolixibacteraceae bacterium]
MKKKLHLWLAEHFVSRTLIFGIDIFLVLLSYVFVQVLWLWHTHVIISFSDSLFLIFSIIFSYGTMFCLFKSYAGIIRQSTFRDISLIFGATASAFVILLAISILSSLFGNNSAWTNTQLFVHSACSFMGLFMWRMAIKIVYYYGFGNRPKEFTKVAIYGAGAFGRTTLQVLKGSSKPVYEVVGYLDDNPSLKNKYVSNIPVLGGLDSILIIKELGVTEVVLSINKNVLSREMRQSITDGLINAGIQVKVAPETEKWMDGTFDVQQIQKVRIEDLLARNPIEVDMNRIATGLHHKIVMVTGAAGSIGSEIVRQLIRFDIKKLILIDQAESALYDLQQELRQKNIVIDVVSLVADASNEFRMNTIFKQYVPQVVFNAAAYKHVPLMEENPYEAIRVNIGACRVLSELAVKYNVEKFVMVSTDKAVNPTNVMGASKRICEMYVQALALRKDHRTSFITTRFGNVLGSNGSVIPLFEKQIAAGGPVTVTHKDITRYFMTIPEACQLVLEAGFMGRGGEIFLFDMGKPVKIYQMARKMIKLSGLEPNRDIKIEVTGLRDGEKLYEELLANEENTLPTHHKKITIAKVRTVDYSEVSARVKCLMDSLNVVSDITLVKQMKELVPEFVSNHSQYCTLDKPNKVDIRIGRREAFEKEAVNDEV